MSELSPRGCYGCVPKLAAEAALLRHEKQRQNILERHEQVRAQRKNVGNWFLYFLYRLKQSDIEADFAGELEAHDNKRAVFDADLAARANCPGRTPDENGRNYRCGMITPGS